MLGHAGLCFFASMLGHTVLLYFYGWACWASPTTFMLSVPLQPGPALCQAFFIAIFAWATFTAVHWRASSEACVITITTLEPIVK